VLGDCSANTAGGSGNQAVFTLQTGLIHLFPRFIFVCGLIKYESSQAVLQMQTIALSLEKVVFAPRLV
jgi:hypothetical protein